MRDDSSVYLPYLLQIQYAPQHLVRLLQIIVEANCDLAVRQVASITFKNFIAKNWSPHEAGKFRNPWKKGNPLHCFPVRSTVFGFIIEILGNDECRDSLFEYLFVSQ